ncbi:MAG: hydantoinase/oxoprolinase family protein [Candidatus Rokubacteria bacterium]|nr:hydantoinase/oxoprolinase family protein [Candidatus Rokubacteria bacterium]
MTANGLAAGGAGVRGIGIGIDVGGTFTDFVLIDPERSVIMFGKSLTTPKDPSDGILSGLAQLLAEYGASFEDVGRLSHATTLVPNALIERKGIRTGLITTAGYRDTLEIGNEYKYDIYDVYHEKPEPLVPRALRREIRGRIGATGAEREPLATEDLAGIVRDFRDAGVASVAVCLIHAYANPAHERAVRDVVSRLAPDLEVSLSGELSPVIREYPRTSTVVANAYVKPLVQRYLTRLDGRIRSLGYKGPLHVMMSEGGIGEVDRVVEMPIRLVESGPAAGTIAAAFVGRHIGLSNVLAFDMGGTTAKLSVVDGGRPTFVNELEVARIRRFKKGSGLPLQVPSVELLEIGAGGGTIAWVDDLGLLKVGPQSAGAAPGPACYGNGGSDATVTDANLLLGYLDARYFLGGEMRLAEEAAHEAVARLATSLGLAPLDTGVGIRAIVNENMAAAARVALTEKGRDPRRYTLVAFGGAGPAHACEVARLLGIGTVVVPYGAGVTAALGLLEAPLSARQARSYVSDLEAIDWVRVRSFITEMRQEGVEILRRAGVAEREMTIEGQVDMRYAGQGYEITVSLDDVAVGPASALQLQQTFETVYRQTFGIALDRTTALEVVTWRIVVEAPSPVASLVLDNRGQSRPSGEVKKGRRNVYLGKAVFADCVVLDRQAMPAGYSVDGPALVEERESTSFVPTGGRLEVDELRNLIIRLGAEQ